MVFVSLYFIIAIQQNHFKRSIILFALSLNLKANAVLYLPELLLALDFHFELVKTALSLLAVIALLYVFAAQFLLIDF